MKLLVACPAKVNLFLSVGPPDAKGWHPIRTVFQAVGWHDVLHVESSRGRTRLTSDWGGLPSDNTLTHALRLAQEHALLPALRIHLEKRLPARAGLGGGSSDAAGLLRALIAITEGSFNPTMAYEVACSVGADVPFFLVGGAAKAEGYGERLQPLPDGPPKWLLIVKPEVGVSTPEAYAMLDQIERTWLPFPEDPWTLHNDFERVMPEMCRALEQGFLRLGAESALLAGSGSAVFGVFADRSSAESAWQSLGKQGTVCPTLTREQSLWMS